MALVIIVNDSNGATISMRRMGFYTYRKTLWGSPILRALGLTLLPMLKNGDFGVTQAQLSLLDNEAQILEANITKIYAAVKPNASDLSLEDLKAYTANIRQAVQEATLTGGSIRIH